MNGEELFLLAGTLNQIGPFDPIYDGMPPYDDGGRDGNRQADPASGNVFPHIRNPNENHSDLFDEFLNSLALNGAAPGTGEEESQTGTYSKSNSTHSEEIVVVGDLPEEEEETYDTMPDNHMGDDFGQNDNPLDDYGDGGSNTEHECPDQPETATESQHPEGFDPELDREIDELAAEIAAEIVAKGDEQFREYSAMIWVDGQGNVHRTSVEPGTATLSTGMDENWAQVDFSNGGHVVAVIHSHPTLVESSLYDPSTIGWISNHNGGTISGEDFDRLLERGGLTSDPEISVAGYDSTNYRSYLVFGGHVSEFYASDQNTADYERGAQATYAVQSSDYDENTGQEGAQHVCPQ